MAKEHKESRATAGMGGKSEKKSSAKKSSGKSKKPHSIHIRRGASGGFIATHHHKAKAGEMAPESEDHVLPDMEQLQQHIGDNMSDQPDQEAAPEPQGGQQAAPAQAAPPAGM